MTNQSLNEHPVASAEQTGSPPGADAWVGFLGVFLEGFPDLHLEVQDSSADEYMVALQILFTGIHAGPFRGAERSARVFLRPGDQSDGDGQVAEHWFQMDAVTTKHMTMSLSSVWWPAYLPSRL